MKLTFKFIVSVLLFSPYSCFSDIHIKVLLAELPLHEHAIIKLSSEQGLVIKSLESQEKQKIYTEEISIALKKGALCVNNQRLTNDKSIIIEPLHEHIVLNDKPYHGCIQLIPYKNNLCIINKIKLEEYVYSVLRTESWPSWSHEMHKLMAVACRSYAVHKLTEAKKANLPYHIKCSNHHQTYEGIHTHTHLKDATAETTGLIMSHKGKPILAMFDICCGGVIPAYTSHLNTTQTPYLARTYPCTACKDLKVYAWNIELERNNLTDLLRQQFSSLKTITEIKISKKDRSGLPEQIVIKDGRKTFYLQGKKLYSLIKNIKSYCYDITRQGDIFIINGRGYGHHIGLCQWGANEMIKDGNDFKETLLFFYPGIKFVKIVQTKTL